jgi:hypothetical protein
MPGATQRASRVGTLTMSEHADHERRADELERETDDLQERSDRLERDIDDTRDDWRRKQRDPAVPGADDDSSPGDFDDVDPEAATRDEEPAEEAPAGEEAD